MSQPYVAAEVLLDALADAESRSARSELYRRLTEMGPSIAPLLVSRLSDERWFVQRNVLLLLRELGARPDGFSPAPFTRHEHPSVRREAIALALTMPAERERALSLALTDRDERTLRLGVRAAREALPDAAVGLLLNRIGDVALPMDLRRGLVRALDGVRAPAALEALLRVTVAGLTMLRQPRLAARSPEMLAALAVLARNWADDRRAARVLARAVRSGDPELRAAAEPASA